MVVRQEKSRTSSQPGAFAYEFIKIVVKELVWIPPHPFDRWASRLLQGAGLVNSSYPLYARLGRPPAVMSGPFARMLYYPVPAGSEFFPKLLGTYEKELHQAIEEICGITWDLVIDIGSAEGYYAVGLARRLRPKKAICYDANPYAERLLRRNARLNNVLELVEARQWCTLEELGAVLSQTKDSLVFCDCEGGEEYLLCPRSVPQLISATIIVEIHDRPSEARMATLIRERFSDTHHIDAIRAVPRDMDDVPSFLTLSGLEAEDAMYEGRPVGMQWFVMKPKCAQT